LVTLKEAVTSRYVESLFFATIESINPENEKPLRVKRTFQGSEYHINCYITFTIKQGLTAGKIVVGDKVLIGFVDADISKPLAIDKLIVTL